MQVVICGGGYAGLAAARRLGAFAPGATKVTLIDQCAGHQLLTRLPAIIGGSIGPRKALIPFQRLLPGWINVVRARIETVDPERMVVVTDCGEFTCDHLILALGTIPGEAGAEGPHAHGTIIKSVQAAGDLRARLAGLTSTAATVRVVIVGAGYTGTEIAGELTSKAFLRLDVTLIAANSQVLPGGNPALGLIADRVLRERGVSLRLGEPVEAVSPSGVTVNGKRVPADVVVWATASVGVKAAGVTWSKNATGRVTIDPYLRADAFERAFVVGDIAAVRDAEGNLVPSSAQLAIQEGRAAADNLLALSAGRVPREFVGRTYGEALSLGDGDGAAEVAGAVLTGPLALASKRAALTRYFYSLGGLRLVREYL